MPSQVTVNGRAIADFTAREITVKQVPAVVVIQY
jgi:hypothetical protein